MAIDTSASAPLASLTTTTVTAAVCAAETTTARASWLATAIFACRFPTTSYASGHSRHARRNKTVYTLTAPSLGGYRVVEADAVDIHSIWINYVRVLCYKAIGIGSFVFQHVGNCAPSTWRA